jgi:hypothetical protein
LNAIRPGSPTAECTRQAEDCSNKKHAKKVRPVNAPANRSFCQRFQRNEDMLRPIHAQYHIGDSNFLESTTPGPVDLPKAPDPSGDERTTHDRIDF